MLHGSDTDNPCLIRKLKLYYMYRNLRMHHKKVSIGKKSAVWEVEKYFKKGNIRQYIGRTMNFKKRFKEIKDFNYDVGTFHSATMW